MLETLAILAIITVLAILWLAGSLFAAMFLTIALAPAALFGLLVSFSNDASTATFGGIVAGASVVGLALIWAPRLCQVHR